ncbi:uncharacterized protein [Physcomitrium patens]|uniref:MYND-type domain-containing protein n=2 Tax=Physcomitrium patens TaxID=3218 RepID=A0A2K1L0V7_PHYPA|nr:DEAD-box ATP-dependent RNA helicase 42-like isoform X1 [Physcomitrium patens]XP_024399737.1 DEAD-box ATP-dependent RNA helicase 42-like isoform X1 [Physcomitrium patens]PNR59652.1 hypothetical protein PHYPA_002444 [Physcomitrium patens]|eukprot:XP_024399729.1 DEAD-box ATP-dependent RNA helicase 42-like isoform X1 [Physcomitrella patens]
MWEILSFSIPAALLIPMLGAMFAAWFFLQQNAKSSDIRRAELQRLQRKAIEELERAERELENDHALNTWDGSRGRGGNFRTRGVPGYGYADRTERESENDNGRNKQDESRGEGVNRSATGAPGHEYGKDRVGFGDVGGWRDLEVDTPKTKRAEVMEYRRSIVGNNDAPETEFNRRSKAESEDYIDKKHDEVRRVKDKQEWEKRRPDLETQARREAEEERKRQSAASENEKRRRWVNEDTQESVRQTQSSSTPRCAVCQKPTRRRCARCKVSSYCSRECQVKHWIDGHKYECHVADTSISPRSFGGDDTF